MVKNIFDNLYCIEFDNQYLMTSTFMRLSEWYESPFPKIRNSFFTREDFEDAYAKRNGTFSYYSDWVGYNVPGSKVISFFQVFNDLNRKEKDFQVKIQPIIQKHGDEFYLIGCVKGDKATLQHELAHGFYMLKERYKEEMDVLMFEYKGLKRLIKWIIKKGYTEDVAKDEAQAYMSTTPYNYKGSNPLLDLKIKLKEVLPFRRVFNQYRKQISE